MTQPLVTVIIPVGPRHAQHCRVAAASALMQSIGNQVEVIVSPDGGADVSPMRGVTLLDPVEVQTGPAATRNRALPHAHGHFITFLDADDYLMPRGLEHLLRAYAEGTYGYVYGNAYLVMQDGSMALKGAPDYVQLDMAKYNLHVITTLIPTKHVRAVGGFDERGDAWEDWRFHIRLAQAGVCGFRTDQPIFVYRVYEGDRMTRFYGGDAELMHAVRRDYINEQGVIPMAGCCGGDATLAQLAAQGIQGAPAPEAVPMGEGMVRVRYTGTETDVPFDTGRKVIRLGTHAKYRYADVTVQEAAWLAERIPIQVVPKVDEAVPPPPPLPRVSETPRALRPGDLRKTTQKLGPS